MRKYNEMKEEKKNMKSPKKSNQKPRGLIHCTPLLTPCCSGGCWIRYLRLKPTHLFHVNIVSRDTLYVFLSAARAISYGVSRSGMKTTSDDISAVPIE